MDNYTDEQKELLIIVNELELQCQAFIEALEQLEETINRQRGDLRTLYKMAGLKWEFGNGQ